MLISLLNLYNYINYLFEPGFSFHILFAIYLNNFEATGFFRFDYLIQVFLLNLQIYLKHHFFLKHNPMNVH